MADTRISNLTAGTPSASDVVAYTNGTTTLKSTMALTVSAGAGTAQRDAILNPVTAGQKMAALGNGTAGFIDDDFEISYIIGNAGTTEISETGLYPSFRTHKAGVIEAIEIVAGTIPGNATLSIWKGNYGTPPVGTSQTIMGAVGTEVITFTGGTKAVGTPTVTAFAKGDYFAPYLDGIGTIPYLTIAIHCRNTAVS